MADNLYRINIKGGAVEKIAEPAAAPAQPRPATDNAVGRRSAPRLLNPVVPKRAEVAPVSPQPKPAAPKPTGVTAAPAQPGPAAPKAVESKEKAGPSSAEAPMADYCDLYAAPVHRLTTLLVYLFAAAVIYGGWLLRDEEYLIAESGPGYVLGIVGGAMMLMLLLYPLRKKMRFMRKWGPIKYWFKVHMFLGVVGPVLVLFHAGFRLGSLNSSVAMVTMLAVAISGLVGRYFYAKIHYGLYGRQMNLKELHSNLEDEKNILKHVLSYAPALQKKLLTFDEAVLRPRYSFLSSMGHFLFLIFYARVTSVMLRLGLRRTLKIAAKREGWSPRERKHQARAARLHISIHMATALRVSRYTMFERLFALWHLFHFPLFIVLVLVAVAHVIAVHMF